MSRDTHGRTTASLEALPPYDASLDPTPGLVLVFSRLHEQLPSALAFTEDVTTLGREPDNSLPIPEAAVSRYHARVERRENGFWIVDRGSTNGTVVNGLRVEEKRLEQHDVVRIGDTILRFAGHGIYSYVAYRIDGTVLDAARLVQHSISDPLLVGGYQVDCLLERIEKVARTDLSVVITGESGTGKELVARQVHRESQRSGPFQGINCAALPTALIESELFGHRKGAFTGAVSDRVGLVKAAHRGTLFLDEIGDMPLEAQSKLLRVLQEKEVMPIGSTTPERIEVRVICATHRNLDDYVREGRFRGDLLARLREVTLELPPLRNRREDIYPLVRYFLGRIGETQLKTSFAYMLALAHYAWPYNVRELESAVKLSVALASQGVLELAFLPEPIQRCLEGHGTRAEGRAALPHGSLNTDPSPPINIVRSSTPSEQQLRDLLALHRGNIAAVGRALGKERMQVHRWLRRYDIDIESYR